MPFRPYALMPFLNCLDGYHRIEPGGSVGGGKAGDDTDDRGDAETEDNVIKTEDDFEFHQRISDKASDKNQEEANDSTHDG